MVDSEEDELCVEREGDQDLSLASREFSRIAASRTKSGFVEGVEAGKDEGLKEGFMAGFPSGIAVASHWAIFRGYADAHRVHHRSQEARADNSQQFLSQLEQVMEEALSAEQQHREGKVAGDMKGYREAVVKERGLPREKERGSEREEERGFSIEKDWGPGLPGEERGFPGENNSSTEEDVQTSEEGNSSLRSSKDMAVSEEVGMDTEGVGVTKSAEEVTFGELVAVMKVPAVLQSIKMRLK